MAIDALTAQLLTSGGNNAGGLAGLGALDPTLAAVQPELQLAQGMEQQGTSTAPAYPGAAIARALQGAIGAGLQKSAISDLGNAYSKSLPGLAHIFKGTQLGDAIESGNPMAIQMALKVAPQVMAASSVPRSLSPGEVSVTGNNPPTQNPNPMTKEAQAIIDAQKLQPNNPAAAAAITGAVSKNRLLDNGVPVPGIPLNPTPPVTGTGGAPSAAIPQPPQQQTPGAPTQPSPQAYLQAREKLAQGLTNASAAGITNPTTTGLADLPSQVAAAAGQKKAAEGLYGGASDALGKEIGGVIETGGKNARDRMNALNTIDDSLTAGGKGVVTGPLADKVLKGKELLNSLGVDTSWVNAGLPESEVVSKMNAQLASASAKAMTGRPTQFEFASWMKNNPGLLNSPQGTHALINILKQTSQQDIDLGKLAQNKSNWDKWGDVVENYYQKNPLKSPFTGQALGQGAPAAPSTVQAPPMTATNPKTGARLQSHDGGHTWAPM